MNAAQVMTRKLAYIDEETPIAVAWKTMQELTVRHLPVVEHGRLVGIVSDRDLLLRATRALSGDLTVPELCAAEVMTFEPVSCQPATPLQAIARQIVERHIDVLPVTDEGGGLVGMVTSNDLMRLIAGS